MINKIMEPLAYIMRWLYSITESYAVALFLFALVVAIICLPLTIISRKNAIKKVQMAPELAVLAKKFAKPKDAPIASSDKPLEEREAILAADRQRQKDHNQAIADVYMKYKYKPWGNWISVIIRYVFIIAVFGVVTAPLTHLCTLPSEITTEIIDFASTFNNEDVPSQLQAFEIMKQNFSDFIKKIPDLSTYYSSVTELPNLSLFGGKIDMAGIPSLKTPNSLLFFPVATYLVGFIQTLIPKITTSIKHKKATKEKQKLMKGQIIAEIIGLLLSPVLLTYFAFKVPPMLCLYYIANTLISTFIGFVLSLTMPMPVVPKIVLGSTEKDGVTDNTNEEAFNMSEKIINTTNEITSTNIETQST